MLPVIFLSAFQMAVACKAKPASVKGRELFAACFIYRFFSVTDLLLYPPSLHFSQLVYFSLGYTRHCCLQAKHGYGRSQSENRVKR